MRYINSLLTLTLSLTLTLRLNWGTCLGVTCPVGSCPGGCPTSPTGYALVSLGHSRPWWKFRGHRSIAPVIWTSEKRWLWVETSVPFFLRLWTKVHPAKFFRAEVIIVTIVRSAVFRMTMSCSSLEASFAIKSQSCPKSGRNFDVAYSCRHFWSNRRTCDAIIQTINLRLLLTVLLVIRSYAWRRVPIGCSDDIKMNSPKCSVMRLLFCVLLTLTAVFILIYGTLCLITQILLLCCIG